MGLDQVVFMLSLLKEMKQEERTLRGSRIPDDLQTTSGVSLWSIMQVRCNYGNPPPRDLLTYNYDATPAKPLAYALSTQNTPACRYLANVQAAGEEIRRVHVHAHAQHLDHVTESLGD